MWRHRLPTLLSRWRIDVATVAAVPLLALAQPRPGDILNHIPLLAAGLALRLWAQGHLERRAYLTHTGPYARVRHPLYVGSFLIGLGLVLMLNVAVLPLAYAATFAAMYWPKILREEQFQHARWGGDWDRYASRTRAVLPRLRPPGWSETGAVFAWSRVRRSGEWKTWLGTVAAVLVLAARAHAS